MSGVYIPSLEMPRGCTDCFLVDCYWRCNSVSRNCRLVEVPECHGRLIDADAIMQNIRDNNKRAFGTEEVPTYSALSIVVDYIEAAPTVIPAESPKEES